MAATLAAAAGLLLLLAAAGGASAQSPTSGCTTVLVSLSPCLNYISGNESSAPAACCSQLGKVAGSDPQCLCVALGADTAALGLSVNRTRALGLPDECKVKTPPVSDCNKAAAPPASGSTGSKTTPSSTTTTAPVNGASPRGSAGMAAVAAVLAVAAI